MGEDGLGDADGDGRGVFDDGRADLVLCPMPTGSAASVRPAPGSAAEAISPTRRGAECPGVGRLAWVLEEHTLRLWPTVLGATAGEVSASHPLNRLLRLAIAKLLICADCSAHGGAVEVMAHAIAAPETGERICESGSQPAARVITIADGRTPLAAASRHGVAMGMTQQYLAGELSVLLGRVQAVTTTEAAGQEAWSLRVAAETGPIQRLGQVTARALALTDRLCWDSLNRGDTGAFNRQAAASAALLEFGVCSGMLRDI